MTMAKKTAKTRKKAAKKAAKNVAKKPVRRAARKAKAATRKPAARAARAPKRKPAAPARPAKRPKTGVAALPAEKQVAGGVLLGHVEDYFAQVSVMALRLLRPVSVGDMIRVKGHTTDITQKVESMQIEHQPVQTASAGDSVGIKIADRARKTDVVYKI
jgi:putative protease